MSQCQSGNGLTENGEGLCLREATTRVEIRQSRRGTMHSKVFEMCRFCAGSWSVKHPATVRIV